VAYSSAFTQTANLGGGHLLDACLLGGGPLFGHGGRLGLGRRPLSLDVCYVARSQPHRLLPRGRQVRQLRRNSNCQLPSSTQKSSMLTGLH
jgi:hypothetical protein